MSELTLEALGYRADEAADARRNHDLIHTPKQRASALRPILASRKGDSPMMQRQIRHDAGTFPVCAACGREPRHIQSRGSHSLEAFDVRHPTGERHRLECNCDVHMHTAWCSSLALALNLWRLHFAAVIPLAPVRPLLRLHKESRSTPVAAR